MVDANIGGRVRQLLAAAPARPQREVAKLLAMTPDAFSRALNGYRAFSSIELAKIADLFQSDVHWIITGEPDPHRLILAARHDFDPSTGKRSNPGRDGDADELRNVELAYRQAYGGNGMPGVLPRVPSELREVLGDDFIRPFVERLESRLGVDVVRIAGVSTAYSFTFGSRHVMVIPAMGNWFRENWSIAHELGHLALGHHVDGASAHTLDRHEAEANAFAAELLLPETAVRAMDWTTIDTAGLALRVWQFGVSTDAIAKRLEALRIKPTPLIREWATQPTQRLLRLYWSGAVDHPDPITQRMEQAAIRKFPSGLVEAHVKLIASGDIGSGTLAWMLEVDRETLDVDAPALPALPDSEDVAEALGL